MPKRVVWSPHALEMLVERGIETAWVERALREPERTEPDPKHVQRRLAFRRIPEFGDRWLRVVYVDEPDAHRVVTVFFDRKAGRSR